MAPLCQVPQYLLLCIIQYNLKLYSKNGPCYKVIIISCDLHWWLFINALVLYSISLHSFPFCFSFFLVLLVYIPLWLLFQAKYLCLGVHTSALDSIPFFLCPIPFQAAKSWWESFQAQCVFVHACVCIYNYITRVQNWAHLVNETKQRFQGCPIGLSVVTETFSGCPVQYSSWSPLVAIENFQCD